MIALILGGAPSVFEEADAANALLGDHHHIVVAANLAGIHYPGHLSAWASLHSDYLADWLAQRTGNRNPRLFTPTRAPDLATDIVAERWSGSSGLFATQAALFEMGATAAILCGVPMDSEAGHFSNPGLWAGTADYRQAFQAALLVIGGRTRSMGGWTRQLFGAPTPEWIGAVDNIAPLGTTRSKNQRTQEMHKVTNRGEGTQSFWARNPNGTDKRVHLQPGEGGEFEINASDPVFNGDLAVEEPDAAPVEAVAAPTPVAPPEPRLAKPTAARRV